MVVMIRRIINTTSLYFVMQYALPTLYSTLSHLVATSNLPSNTASLDKYGTEGAAHGAGIPLMKHWKTGTQNKLS